MFPADSPLVNYNSSAWLSRYEKGRFPRVASKVYVVYNRDKQKEREKERGKWTALCYIYSHVQKVANKSSKLNK